MEELSITYCRLCGSDIFVSEEFCPKCGGRQKANRKVPSTGWLVVLVIAGLLGIILLGIVSAVALPRLASCRTRECNMLAYKNVVTAKKALDRYSVSNGAYHDTVEQPSFKADEGVSVNLIKTGETVCTQVVVHVNGSKEFAACSGEPDIFCRNRNSSDSRFLAIT
jgi:type II secretory pathway pseudopilin PulG